MRQNTLLKDSSDSNETGKQQFKTDNLPQNGNAKFETENGIKISLLSLFVKNRVWESVCRKDKNASRYKAFQCLVVNNRKDTELIFSLKRFQINP